jgi:allophanate hydrolase
MSRNEFLSARPDNAWITRLSPALISAAPNATAAAAPQALAGLTFAVKDNIDVAGVATTAACPDFAYTPAEHATAVANLLSAGARLYGKTNLDQFACGLNGTRSPYGAVPCALNPDYICGGSSSGSAYVVATGQVDFSLGTDTAGSGRVPAAFNNIVGLKPSRGLISTHGVVSAARSVDCVSIFARDVATAWRAFLVARQFDARDPYARKLKLRCTPFSKELRLGIPRQCEWYGDALSAQEFERAIAMAEKLGAEVVEIDFSPFIQAADLLYGSALIAERLEVLETFFEHSPNSVMEPVYTLLSPGSHYSATDVFRAMTRLKTLSQQAAQAWADIDVLMVPTAPTQYTIAQMLANPIELNRRLGYYTNFVNLLDYAAIAVPSSFRGDGLAFGVTLIAPTGSDWALADWGMRYHEQTGLNLGATHESITTGQTLEPLASDSRWVRVAVVGAHLSGMPLNWQLRQYGARLLQATTTTDSYRLFALANTQPPKPGLIRVAPGQGGCIAIEIWELPIEHYGEFVALIPSPLGIGQIDTADAGQVQGFLCESHGLQGARDITALGGWKNFLSAAAA